MARSAFTRPLFIPFRLALWRAENLAAVTEATRSFPRFERALSTQLSALLAQVGELNLSVEQDGAVGLLLRCARMGAVGRPRDVLLLAELRVSTKTPVPAATCRILTAAVRS